jgi:hypothetical protein
MHLVLGILVSKFAVSSVTVTIKAGIQKIRSRLVSLGFLSRWTENRNVPNYDG